MSGLSLPKGGNPLRNPSGMRCRPTGFPSADGNDRRFERNPIPNDANSHLPERPKHDEKPANWLTVQRTISLVSEVEARENFSKLSERCANVIENKGPLRITCGRSRNVYENTGTWPHKAGMSLKIKVVKWRRQVAVRPRSTLATGFLRARLPPLRHLRIPACGPLSCGKIEVLLQGKGSHRSTLKWRAT